MLSRQPGAPQDLTDTSASWKVPGPREKATGLLTQKPAAFILNATGCRSNDCSALPCPPKNQGRLSGSYGSTRNKLHPVTHDSRTVGQSDSRTVGQSDSRTVSKTLLSHNSRPVNCLLVCKFSLKHISSPGLEKHPMAIPSRLFRARDGRGFFYTHTSKEIKA